MADSFASADVKCGAGEAHTWQQVLIRQANPTTRKHAVATGALIRLALVEIEGRAETHARAELTRGARELRPAR